MFSSSVQVRWAPASRRSLRRPAAASRCTTPRRARSSAASQSIERSLTKLAEKGGADPAERARADRAGRRSRPGGPPDRGGRRGARGEGGDLPSRRRGAAAGGDPRLEHSSIPITSLAAVTKRPERVIGMHFFNPVPVLKLVEVIRGLATSDETTQPFVELAVRFRQNAGRSTRLPGFVSNRVLMPHQRGCIHAARRRRRGEAVDKIPKLGSGTRWARSPSPT